MITASRLVLLAAGSSHETLVLHIFEFTSFLYTLLSGAFMYKACLLQDTPGSRISVIVSSGLTIQNCCRPSRSALVITETELKLMAAAAIIGLSKIPKNGYSIPAAIGTPTEL